MRFDVANGAITSVGYLLARQPFAELHVQNLMLNIRQFFFAVEYCTVSIDAKHYLVRAATLCRESTRRGALLTRQPLEPEGETRISKRAHLHDSQMGTIIVGGVSLPL